MVTDIVEAIKRELPGAEVLVRDPDGQHFEAIVVSEKFEGLSLVRQHQLVMKALKDQFETTVHALQLQTLTPSQWRGK